MVSITRWIPNSITLASLFVGFVGIIHALNVSYYQPLKTFHQADLVFASWMVVVAAILDFMDGLLARLFNAQSPLGKQLDGLADVVCFGVLPAVILHVLMLEDPDPPAMYNWLLGRVPIPSLFPFVVLGAAAVRLGRFNIHSPPHHHFKGLPVPFSAFIVASIPMVTTHQHIIVWNGQTFYLDRALFQVEVLIGLSVILAILMLSRIPMLSLKWDLTQRKRPPWIIWLFVILAIGIILTGGYLGLWGVIILYFIYSLIFTSKVKRL